MGDETRWGATDWLKLVATIVGLPAATYYPFMFLRVQWFKSAIGRSMLSKGMALALLFWGAILAVPAEKIGWEQAHEWFMVVVAWFVVFAVHYQVWTMRKVQESGELNDKMGVGHDSRHDS